MQELDLSRSNITLIEEGTFNPVKESLQRLLLGETMLTSLPTTLVKNLPELEMLDISGNKFVCDKSLGKCEDRLLGTVLQLLSLSTSASRKAQRKAQILSSLIQTILSATDLMRCEDPKFSIFLLVLSKMSISRLTQQHRKLRPQKSQKLVLGKMEILQDYNR